jgi:chaperonin cofactor prefoldin
MPVMLDRWNDDKMDALEAKVIGLADQMSEHRQETRELRRELRQEIHGLRQEMKAGFDRIDDRSERVDDRFERIDDRFERIDDRFERMQRAMLNAAVAISSSFLAGFAALIVLIATKL